MWCSVVPVTLWNMSTTSTLILDCRTTVKWTRQATVEYCISDNIQWVYIVRWIVLEPGCSTHSTAVCRSGAP